MYFNIIKKKIKKLFLNKFDEIKIKKSHWFDVLISFGVAILQLISFIYFLALPKTGRWEQESLIYLIRNTIKPIFFYLGFYRFFTFFYIFIYLFN